MSDLVLKEQLLQLVVTPNFNGPESTRANFFTNDNGTAAQVIQLIRPDGEPYPLKDYEKIVAMYKFPYSQQKIWPDITVIDVEKSIVRILVPADRMIPEEDILCEVAINFADGRDVTAGQFLFSVTKSLMHEEIPEVTSFYVHEFAELHKEVTKVMGLMEAEITVVKMGLSEGKTLLDQWRNDLSGAEIVTQSEFAILKTEVKEDVIQLREDLNSSLATISGQIETITDLMANEANAILGVRWDKKSNPTLTRIRNSVGLNAEVGVDGVWAENDFDNAPIYREIGEVTDELGNVFIKIPKFYIRKRDGEMFKTWEVSKTKYPGFYLPHCFYDFDNKRELPYILIGKYKATVSNNKLESKPDVYPAISTTIVNFRTFAKNNNTSDLKGYQLLDIHTVDVIQTLFYIEFATLNSQSIMPGFTSGRYVDTDLIAQTEEGVNRVIIATSIANNYRVEQSISVGTTLGGNQVFYGRTITKIEAYDGSNSAIYFDGEPVTVSEGNILYNSAWKNGFSKNILTSSGSIWSNTDGKYPCAYRGIESPWGDMWQFIDGININDYQVWVADDASNYASNVFATPYKKINYVNSDISDKYASQMGHDENEPYAMFPVETGGSSTTYYADYYYCTAGQRVARVGGSWSDGSSAGLSSWNLTYASSDVRVFLGARLLKKPL